MSGIASDRLLKAVLNSALAEAELEELPAKLGPFERFVSGPLRISLTTLLGKQSYDAVTRALTPVLRQAREEVPPRSSGDMVAVKRRMAPTRKHLRCALVMHPDEAEAARISEALETHCTLLLTASCGYRALGMAIKNRPQAVVAALATPNITGAEMIAQLAALLGDEAPPVVIIGDKSAVDGARAVLSEPVDTDELIDVLT